MLRQRNYKPFTLQAERRIGGINRRFGRKRHLPALAKDRLKQIEGGYPTGNPCYKYCKAICSDTADMVAATLQSGLQ